MRASMIFAAAAALLAACSTHEAKQAGGVVGMTSAVIVALPLIPFAEVYHAVSNTKGKTTAKFDAWERTFGPVYLERAKLIAQRDPILDARAIASRGHFAYLPTVPMAGVYPGLVYGAIAKTRGENNKTIQSDELLSYLQTLMSDDTKDKNREEAGYRLNPRAEAYATFAAAGLRYKEGFNKEMATAEAK